jgi:hypothetical protein
MAGVIELPEVTITAGQESEEERRRREILEATRAALQGMASETAPALAAVQQTAIGATPPAPATPAAPVTPPRPPQAFGRAAPADVGRGEPSRYPFPGGLEAGAELPPRPGAQPVPQAPGAYQAAARPGAVDAFLAARAAGKGGDPATPQPPSGAPPRNAGQEAADRQGLADAQAASDQQRRMRLAIAALAGAWGGLGPDRMGRLMAQAREPGAADPLARAQEQVGQRREAQQAEQEASETARRQALEERRVAATEERVAGADERRETSERLAEDLRNPESPISRADQAALATAAEMFGGEVAGALTPERIQALPSSTIRSNPALRDIMIQGRQNDAHAARMEADQARADRRQAQRGAHGGGGGAAVAERRAQLVAATRARYPEMTAEEVEAMVPRSRRNLERYELATATARLTTQEAALRGEATAERQMATRAAVDDAESEIPGYVRTPGAPRGLSAATIERLRGKTALLDSAQSLVRRLDQLRAQISPADIAQARAGGALSPALSEALAINRQMQGVFRKMQEFGVPTGDEFARVEAALPSANTVQGFLNAQEAYPAFLRVMVTDTNSELSARGYVPRSARVRVRRGGQVGTVSARNLRPDDEVVRE